MTTAESFASPSYIYTVQANSSVLEGVFALIFDVFILGSSAFFAHSICSSFNLFLIYDKRRTVRLRVPRLVVMGQGPAGHWWLSSILSALLFLCGAAVVAIGFSVNGRTETKFTPKVFPAVVGRAENLVPLVFDYDTEYSAVEEDGASRPGKVSQRIVAIGRSDECKINGFSGDLELAHAYNSTQIDKRLVSGTSREIQPICISKKNFREDLQWRVVRGARPKDAECSFSEVRPKFEGNSSTASASFDVDQCDLDLKTMQCFRRDRKPDHCVALGYFNWEDDEGGSNFFKYMVLLPNATDNPAITEVTPMFSALNISEEHYGRFALNAAYFASLEMADRVEKIESMAIGGVRENVTLYERSDVVNVSDIDLRIFVPALVFCVVLVVSLLIISTAMWYVSVFSKGRQHFNKFCSIQEVLQVLCEGSQSRDKTQHDRKLFPSVGLRRNQPQLAVQEPGGDILGNSTWIDDEVW